MKADRAMLLGMIAVLFVLTVALVLPYAQFVLAAVLLAFVLQPLHRRLFPRTGKTLSATILVVLSSVAVLLPFLAIVSFVANDLLEFARSLEDKDLDFQTLEEPIADYTGIEINIQSIIQSSGETAGQWLFSGALSAFETTVHLLIGLGLLLFLLFYLVRDGDRFVRWIELNAPLPGAITRELFERVRRLTNAVLAGHVLVAIIQGTIAGIGLAVTGIPNFVFWTVIMIILSLIPIIGSFVIWAPASAYLVMNGQLAAGVALFIYGTIVVGVSDDYLRPVITDRYAMVSPSVIIVGVIGGLSVFGFMGLFLGPIVVGALKETIEIYNEHYGHATTGSTG
jgi:predicted PurR-regulated permease PerM